MLTLRLSDEDYRLLRAASIQDGARSLSDYARDSLFRNQRPAAEPTHALRDKIDEFELEIDALKLTVRRLQNLVVCGTEARE